MKILAIESSCDETAAAVVENGRRVLSSVVATQEKNTSYTAVSCRRLPRAATAKPL